MTRNYQEITTPFGNTVITYEEDGVLYTIPKDPANSDYQAYLNPVEHLTEIPTPPVVEETAPEEEAPTVEEETI